MVCGVEVMQGQGMAVLPQGRAGLGVTEALLGLEQMAVGDQDGRDGVPQTVQADLGVPVLADEGGKPVPQSASR